MLEVKVCGLTDAGGGARGGRGRRPLAGLRLLSALAARAEPGAGGGAGGAGAGRLPHGRRAGRSRRRAARRGAERRSPLDALQLHGAQTPERVAAIKAATGCLVIKALSVADARGSGAGRGLCRGRRPAAVRRQAAARRRAALPGGNGLSLRLAAAARASRSARPWLLSGGLSAANLESAVRLSGARAVDVSSGVEDRPGHKDPARIRRIPRGRRHGRRAGLSGSRCGEPIA